MRDLPLGELLASVKDEVVLQDDEVYATIGILSYGKGLFTRPPVRGSETSYKSYFRVTSGQFVYSKLFAWEGALAVVDESFDGLFVSPEFPTFEINRAVVEPAFLRLLCGWKPLWQRLRAGETGMGGRRKRVHPGTLLATPVPVPDLESQRRMVDLADAASAAIERSQILSVAIRSLTNALLFELIERTDWERVTLGNLLTNIDGGRSPVTEGRRPGPGERSVLKLSAVRPGRFQPGETKALGDDVVMPESALVRVGDVLITRSNTPATVGAVCYVDDVPPNTFLSDLTLRLTCGDRLHPGYLSSALNTNDARYQIVSSAKGTSGSMRKISREAIRRYEIPLPPYDQQATIAETLAVCTNTQKAADLELERLLALRAALISELLSGAHEIPSSYDDLSV